MNRIPFFFPGGTSHYYDEDADRCMDMGHGITMVRTCKATTKKVTKWDINFVRLDGPNAGFVGGVTNVRGLNLYLLNITRHQRAEVKGLENEADVFHAAKLLIEVLFK